MLPHFLDVLLHDAIFHVTCSRTDEKVQDVNEITEIINDHPNNLMSLVEFGK